jgi:hypothetical protein
MFTTSQRSKNSVLVKAPVSTTMPVGPVADHRPIDIESIDAQQRHSNATTTQGTFDQFKQQY